MLRCSLFRFAIKEGFRHIDCAYCYGNEKEMGEVTECFGDDLGSKSEILKYRDNLGSKSEISKYWDNLEPESELSKVSPAWLVFLTVLFTSRCLVRWWARTSSYPGKSHTWHPVVRAESIHILSVFIMHQWFVANIGAGLGENSKSCLLNQKLLHNIRCWSVELLDTILGLPSLSGIIVRFNLVCPLNSSPGRFEMYPAGSSLVFRLMHNLPPVWHIIYVLLLDL